MKYLSQNGFNEFETYDTFDRKHYKESLIQKT